MSRTFSLATSPLRIYAQTRFEYKYTVTYSFHDLLNY